MRLFFYFAAIEGTVFAYLKTYLSHCIKNDLFLPIIFQRAGIQR